MYSLITGSPLASGFTKDIYLKIAPQADLKLLPVVSSCNTLYCTSFCTVLYCTWASTVLYCVVLSRPVLSHNVLGTLWSCAVLYCMVLCCAIVNSAVLQVMRHFPAGTSNRNLVHFGQGVRSGRTARFLPFSFPTRHQNWEAYGAEEPKEYSLKEVGDLVQVQ